MFFATNNNRENIYYEYTGEISRFLNSSLQVSGYDEISIEVLKLSLSCIISLIYVCNKSLLKSIFPTRLKFSQIIPILKKGKKSEISNYRPIFLLTSFSKIFEKIIFNRLYNHVNTNNILAQEQYGFRTNSSTEMASYNFINNILALNNKFIVGGIFCDLTKAFDCVNHSFIYFHSINPYKVIDNLQDVEHVILLMLSRYRKSI